MIRNTNICEEADIANYNMLICNGPSTFTFAINYNLIDICMSKIHIDLDIVIIFIIIGFLTCTFPLKFQVQYCIPLRN